MQTPLITLTAPALLYAAALHVSTDPHRSHISGVQIEAHPDGGAWIVATDGHRLSAAFDGSATVSPGSVILPVDKTLLRHLAHKSAARVVWDGSTLAVLTAAETVLGMAPCRAVDAVFPDWRRVIPESCSGEAASFNPSYLALYEKVAKVLAGRGSRPVTITPNGAGPAWVTFGGFDAWFGVLMPVHSRDHFAPALPRWLAGSASK